MKHLKLGISFVLALIVASAFISAKSQERVKVFSVSGQADYLKAGKAEWKTVKHDMHLYSGDGVKTGKDSSVELVFDERKKNIVEIKPNTHVILKLLPEEKIELIDGEVFALIKSIPRGSRFEIRTPTAVCGARGTGFGARANKNETTVSAYENDSYAKGIDRSGNIPKKNLTVKQGFKTIVKLFGKPSKLIKLTGKDYDRWNKWKDDLLERLQKALKRTRLARDLEDIQRQKERMVERKDADRIRKRTEGKSGGGTYETNKSISPE